MNRRLFLGLGVALPFGAWAQQQKVMTLDQLINAGQQFLAQNLDPELLKAVPEVDRDQVAKFLTRFQQDLQGNYVVDMASLRTAARATLPLLQAHPDTRPYAGWLATRLDYLDVADQFRLLIPAPVTTPGQPPPPRPNPTPQQQRQVWEKQVATEPAPKDAPAFLPRLKKLFAAQGVPPQLVWVAEVESSFNPSARSPAGAVGLFQFMPQTAQGLGMKLSPRDERLDPDKSGTAAAKYLRTLYPRFKDWRLTMAAYNWGQGNVRRLLESQRATSFDAVATRMPAETQMYVPKVDAVIKRRERLALAQLPAPTR